MTESSSSPYGLKPADITDAGTKAAPVDADSLVGVDSEDSNSIKRFTWPGVKAAAKSWLTGISNAWTAPQTAPYQALSFDSTIADDCDSGSLNRSIVLTGNVTDLTLTGGVDGQNRYHRIEQDGTGNWTVTWSGVTGTAPTVPSNPDDFMIVQYRKEKGLWRFIAAYHVT